METTTQENPKPKKNFGSVLLIIGIIAAIIYMGYRNFKEPKAVEVVKKYSVVAVDSVKTVRDSIRRDSVK